MRNVEAKFRAVDLKSLEQRAVDLGFKPSAVFEQHDTFFKVPHGRLKLRREERGAELIFYRREKSGGLERSDYEIFSVAQPGQLRQILGAALGVTVEVRKRRILLLRRNVRLHLDDVDGLGSFGELEAAVNPGGDENQSRAEVLRVLEQLGIQQSELIGVPYAELLMARVR